ncbi:MAG: arginine--tRNA ligase [Rickettsiales bacterium]|nr:arginine--tRNA ligase [Rickettsiales bacterium]
MTILETLDGELEKIFNKLNYDNSFARFQYSDRPDLSDFQTNCAMPMCKILHKSPREIADVIVIELEKSGLFENITVDGPGFVNVKIKNDVLLDIINDTMDDEKCGYLHGEESKTVVIDFGGYNIAKEPHVGHLRSTVIGESIRRIYKFCGDKVISDVHQGDWGLPMGMVIEGIRLKYSNAKCFREDFNDNKIDDLQLTAQELTEIYRASSAKAKEDKEFDNKIHETTTKLQNGYEPYIVLWKYFAKISIDDLKEISEDIFGAHFDYWNGESCVHELIKIMLRNLIQRGIVIGSRGAKIIDISDKDGEIPPVIVENSTGAIMYATSDIATILDRIQKFNCDLMLYVVDGRQSLHLRQVFLACEKIGLLNERHRAEHCSFGTMNGKDNKPFKTRSGENVKLRDLINDVIEKISEKSDGSSKDTIKNIAVACIKFMDLMNYRESNYIFDTEQFTNYEGKTGAYILYSVVRIKSILSSQEKFTYKIVELRTKEEKGLLLELSKFSDVVRSSYGKKAPNFIAEYVYTLAKKFSSFYANCNINNESDIGYKKSKISLIYLVKQYIEVCIDLLGMRAVDSM